MTRAPSILVWFDRDTLPEILPDPAIVLGGTALLRQFIDLVAVSAGGRLSIAAPFAGRGVFKQIASWESLPHTKLDLSLVTQTNRDALTILREVGSLPWRSFDIRVYPLLHAKIYAFLAPSGAGACLVGSHNLTRAGAGRNEEAGALFASTRHPEVCHLIQACDERVRSLSRKARPFIDHSLLASHESVVTTRRR